MAQKVVQYVEVTSDIGGHVIAEGEAVALTFSVGAVTYELDLDKGEAEAFHQLVAPYKKAGRVVGKTRRKAPAGGGPVGYHTDVCRNWARLNGWPDLPDRGRLPAEAIAAYFAANPNVQRGKWAAK